MEVTAPRAWRSFLFVPGDRPERFGKALAAGADAVCMDLEDAVAPANKVLARELIQAFLVAEAPAGVARAVRVNALTSRLGLLDLVALGALDRGPDAVLLPKIEAAAVCAVAAGALPDTVELVALIESVRGIAAAPFIAAMPRVSRLVFGSADYAAEVGCDMGPEALALPRAQIAQAAAAAGLQAIDGAWLDLDDEAGLSEDCVRARALGFTGKPALHPRQVAAITRAFTPSEREIERAHAIAAASDAAGGGVAVLDGRMLDDPVVRQARRVLSSAAPRNSNPDSTASKEPTA